MDSRNAYRALRDAVNSLALVRRDVEYALDRGAGYPLRDAQRVIEELGRTLTAALRDELFKD